MKLSFVKKHLSIDNFPDAELPPFALLTGLNGAGKTHLLQAIRDGAIKVDAVPDHKNQIRYFDWNDLVPSDSQPFDGRSLVSQRQELFSYLEGNRPKYLDRVDQAARKANVPEKLISDPLSLATISEEELEAILGGSHRAAQAKGAIAEAIRVASAKLRGGLPSDDMRDLLDVI